MNSSLPWWIALGEHLPEVVLLAWFFAVGACVGSLLNVVIHRLPRGMNLWRPRSHCPRCKEPILVRDNIPLWSWLRLGGRCRHCGEPIPGRYPLVELICGLLFLAVAWAEVAARGWNLPLVLQEAVWSWPRWRFPWLPAAVALAHAAVLAGMLAAAWIARDGFPVPWRLTLVLFFLAGGAVLALYGGRMRQKSAGLPYRRPAPRVEPGPLGPPLGPGDLLAALAAGGASVGLGLLLARLGQSGGLFPQAGDFQPVASDPGEAPSSDATSAAGQLALVAPVGVMLGLPGVWLSLVGAAAGSTAAWFFRREQTRAGWCTGLWLGAVVALFGWRWWWSAAGSLQSGGLLALVLAAVGCGAAGVALAAAYGPMRTEPEEPPCREKEPADARPSTEPGTDS